MNRQRIQRLVQLLGLLQGGKSRGASELAKASGVSRRTIFRDFETLREAGVPVEYDDERQLYRLPTTYFLAPTKLTPDEAMAVIILCHELGAEDRLPFLADARSAAVKIENMFPENLRERMQAVAHAVSIRLAFTNPMHGQRSNYQALIEAISNSQAIRLSYASLSESKSFRTKFHPYHLVFHQHSWYAIGRSSIHKLVRTLNLGRISDPELLPEKFTIPRGFSLDRYFGNAWRMIPEDGPDERVVIRFSALVARNVAEVQWHPTQTAVINPDGTLTFEATVSGIGEITWWILGYGHHAEVIAPQKLRERVRDHVMQLAKVYGQDDLNNRADEPSV